VIRLFILLSSKLHSPRGVETGCCGSSIKSISQVWNTESRGILYYYIVKSLKTRTLCEGKMALALAMCRAQAFKKFNVYRRYHISVVRPQLERQKIFLSVNSSVGYSKDVTGISALQASAWLIGLSTLFITRRMQILLSLYSDPSVDESKSLGHCRTSACHKTISVSSSATVLSLRATRTLGGISFP